MIKIVRGLLSLLLVFGVYTETGIWTALAVFLITIGIEATQFQLNVIHRQSTKYDSLTPVIERAFREAQK